MVKIVGIDEVGRGPLAGPVTVCIVSCDSTLYTALKCNKELPLLGQDSKKLKPDSRQKYDKVLRVLSKAGKIKFAIVHRSNILIDSRGIAVCIRESIADGLKKLKLNPLTASIFLDGGLRAPKEFKKQKTIIRGDEKEKIIAWASILAKVSRDSLMVKYGKQYPLYELGVHKGYGTLKHRNALKKHGLLALHRKTFCKKY